VEVERLLARVQPREVHHLRPELHELRRGGRGGLGGGVRVREEAAAALAEVPALGAVERLLFGGWLRLAVGAGVGGGLGGLGVGGAVDDEVVIERVGSRREREEAAWEAEQLR